MACALEKGAVQGSWSSGSEVFQGLIRVLATTQDKGWDPKAERAVSRTCLWALAAAGRVVKKQLLIKHLTALLEQTTCALQVSNKWGSQNCVIRGLQLLQQLGERIPDMLGQKSMEWLPFLWRLFLVQDGGPSKLPATVCTHALDCFDVVRSCGIVNKSMRQDLIRDLLLQPAGVQAGLDSGGLLDCMRRRTHKITAGAQHLSAEQRQEMEEEACLLARAWGAFAQLLQEGFLQQGQIGNYMLKLMEGLFQWDARNGHPTLRVACFRAWSVVVPTLAGPQAHPKRHMSLLLNPILFAFRMPSMPEPARKAALEVYACLLRHSVAPLPATASRDQQIKADKEAVDKCVEPLLKLLSGRETGGAGFATPEQLRQVLSSLRSVQRPVFITPICNLVSRYFLPSCSPASQKNQLAVEYSAACISSFTQLYAHFWQRAGEAAAQPAFDQSAALQSYWRRLLKLKHWLDRHAPNIPLDFIRLPRLEDAAAAGSAGEFGAPAALSPLAYLGGHWMRLLSRLPAALQRTVLTDVTRLLQMTVDMPDALPQQQELMAHVLTRRPPRPATHAPPVHDRVPWRKQVAMQLVP
ncbi:hypothetical protein WJX72_008873 [[Myrmecia] bisecta]|uniref:Telomere-associated protein Rif1 N-terminal domain-containing protein n=1 Tax=[Myrmecia] bisecta TaxID=41462 RepID=A0AAW1QS13_9CHLO